jgi:predicted permease
MLILGVSLAKGPDWNSVSLGLNLSIAFAKLCVMPLVGLGSAILLKNYVFDGLGPGPNFYLVVVLVTCTPTSNSLIVMAELGNQDKKALATCIFTQYMLAPFLLTASTWLAISAAID